LLVDCPQLEEVLEVFILFLDRRFQVLHLVLEVLNVLAVLLSLLISERPLEGRSRSRFVGVLAGGSVLS